MQFNAWVGFYVPGQRAQPSAARESHGHRGSSCLRANFERVSSARSRFFWQDLCVLYPNHRQEEATMRSLLFALALAAGGMGSEDAAARNQRELQPPGAFSSISDRTTRSKALFFRKPPKSSPIRGA
jgi:hypothetical protein